MMFILYQFIVMSFSSFAHPPPMATDRRPHCADQHCTIIANQSLSSTWYLPCRIHPSIIICLHPLPHHHPSMICYCIVLCHDIPWGQLPLRCWKLQHGTPWWIVWIWKMQVAWLDAGCCFLLLDGVVQRTKQARASEQRATLQYSTVRTWLVPAWW